MITHLMAQAVRWIKLQVDPYVQIKDIIINLSDVSYCVNKEDQVDTIINGSNHSYDIMVVTFQSKLKPIIVREL